MRKDLQAAFTTSHLNPAQLSTFQRIILTTDGTLTEILEAYLLEKIKVVKLSEETVKTVEAILPLAVQSGTEVIERKILLQGKISRRNFIYAESILVPERLDENLKYGLANSKEPMGRLWLENKIETFKEIIDSGEEAAGSLADYFTMEPEDKLLSRTYIVYSQRQPITRITEKFPASYFLQDF